MRIVTAAAMLIATAPALAAEDPAIAICELLAQSELAPALHYQRTEASIVGVTVLLEFTTTFGATAPQPASRSCTFRLNASGEFSIDHQKTTPVCEEAVRIATVRNEQTKAGNPIQIKPGEPTNDQLIKTLQTCQSILAGLVLKNIETEGMLSSTRIYPIPTANTALNASPPDLTVALKGEKYDRSDASYVTSSKSPAVLDYVVCLEAATRRQPGENIGAKLGAAAMFCASKASAIPPGEPGAWQLGQMVLECGFRPGDASPDAGC